MINLIKENKKFFIISAAVLYFLSAGVSYALFRATGKTEKDVVSPVGNSSLKSGVLKIDPQMPRDQECPLNGAYFTKPEREIWEKRRPLLAMIENHQESRPQSGLSRADIVYEVVAEGGITRFMGVFYCAAAAGSEEPYDIGPVRSTRTYFLDWASEYGDYPLYNHVGGAGACDDPTVHPKAKALCQIGEYGWKDKGSWGDMDQFALPVSACRREPERTGESRATEHTMYCDTFNLWKIAAERGLTNKTEKTGLSWDNEFRSWLFKEDAPLAKRGEVNKISFSFWSGHPSYDVSWQYDKEENIYRRFNGGQPHKDFRSGAQLTAKNVVIQFVSEQGPVDEHKHMLYGTIGQGKAIVFQDGQAIAATWTKKSRQERTVFFDKTGREIRFNRGVIWIEALPAGNKVEY